MIRSTALAYRHILILALFALAVSCTRASNTAGPPPANVSPKVLVAQIAEGEWRATRLTVEGKSVELAADHRPTFAVDETGRVHGLATLNRYFGQIEFEESGKVHWAGPVGSTRMAGPEPLMDQETAFLHALQAIDRGALRDGRLILEDSAAQSRIEFER